jgi:hypothetical protein
MRIACLGGNFIHSHSCACVISYKHRALDYHEVGRNPTTVWIRARVRGDCHTPTVRARCRLFGTSLCFRSSIRLCPFVLAGVCVGASVPVALRELVSPPFGKKTAATHKSPLSLDRNWWFRVVLPCASSQHKTHTCWLWRGVSTKSHNPAKRCRTRCRHYSCCRRLCSSAQTR